MNKPQIPYDQLVPGLRVEFYRTEGNYRGADWVPAKVIGRTVAERLEGRRREYVTVVCDDRPTLSHLIHRHKYDEHPGVRYPEPKRDDFEKLVEVLRNAGSFYPGAEVSPERALEAVRQHIEHGKKLADALNGLGGVRDQLKVAEGARLRLAKDLETSEQLRHALAEQLAQVMNERTKAREGCKVLREKLEAMTKQAEQNVDHHRPMRETVAAIVNEVGGRPIFQITTLYLSEALNRIRAAIA